MTATQLQPHDVRGRVEERSIGDGNEVHGLATRSFMYVAKSQFRKNRIWNRHNFNSRTRLHRMKMVEDQAQPLAQDPRLSRTRFQTACAFDAGFDLFPARQSDVQKNINLSVPFHRYGANRRAGTRVRARAGPQCLRNGRPLPRSVLIRRLRA
jgi:hypothetical protein